MKKHFIFLPLIWALACVPGRAQVYVNGVEIDTLRSPYCQLICEQATLFTRARVFIDYGQRYVDTGMNRPTISGHDSVPVTFNSPMDALNFMTRHGWELVMPQVAGTSSGSERTFIYLLRWRQRPRYVAN